MTLFQGLRGRVIPVGVSEKDGARRAAICCGGGESKVQSAQGLWARHGHQRLRDRGSKHAGKTPAGKASVRKATFEGAFLGQELQLARERNPCKLRCVSLGSSTSWSAEGDGCLAQVGPCQAP